MHPQSRTEVSVLRPPCDNINWALENREQKRGHKKGGALFHLLIVNIFAFFFGKNLFVTIFSASAIV